MDKQGPQLNLINVANEVRRGVKQLEWIAKLSAALERIGSLEQAERETTSRLEIMREEVKDLIAVIKKHKGTIKTATDKAAERLQASQEKAQGIITEAEKEAADLKAKTQQECEGQLSGATRKIIANETNAKRQLDHIFEQVNDGRAQALAFRDELGNRQSELEAINSKIDEAKAKARALFE